ncbi:MAG: hypothetical protein ACYTCU_10300 [Planctomycetota bacterium]|jgi:hypothetical protein
MTCPALLTEPPDVRAYPKPSYDEPADVAERPNLDGWTFGDAEGACIKTAS